MKTARAVPKSFLRVMDANLNRTREGLRVCEELARFILEDERLTRRVQQLRYAVSQETATLSRLALIQARDARKDVARPSRRGKLKLHQGWSDLATANLMRVMEALRVLEEFTRLKDPVLSQRFSSLRFRAYTLEQDLLPKLSSLRHR